jgi:DHA1 family tetracycline resistance protein-like MFS transporter
MAILFLIVFIDLVGFGVIIPLLPFYAEHFQASPTQVGLLMASFSLAQFATAPLWGRLSDSTGRRPVLIATLAAASVSYLALAFATELWMLFAARVVGGVMAGNIATAFAYAADISTPGQRAKAMGVVGAAFGLGFIFGPAIGGMVAGADPASADFRSPALVAAGLSAAACLMTLIRLPESLPAAARRAAARRGGPGRLQLLITAMRQPGMRGLIVLAFASTLVFAGMETIFALWSRRQFGWGPEQNGYIFAFIGLISAFFQGGLIGPLASRLGEIRLVIAGAAALSLGMLAIPYAFTWPLLLPAMALAGIGFSLMTPSLNSLVSLRAPAAVLGSMMGVTRSATTLARVVGPAGAGLLFERLGKDSPFFVGAAIMAGLVWFAFQVGRRAALSADPAD